ncbi:MAG: radical SAM family heme chaperone HemW [Proteobacteria bacterium]|nr:radical SAM family heme chaperone HemW [Pseudomonadota bacterium]
MTFGIYFHVPFCRSKCYYCGFYSITNLSLQDDYINALLKEIYNKKILIYELSKKYKKITIFLGGGTPTLLKLKNLEKILNSIKDFMDKVIEFTIEANPESVTKEKIEIYRSFGINRISIGIQSFDDDVLSFLGRPHRLKDSLKALEIAKKYFDNISIDLLGGIPNFKNTSETSEKYIIEFKPKHISFYNLSKDKKNIWSKKIRIDDSKQTEDYINFCDLLKNLDYEHYEISNFSFKGYQCKHNINYWQRGEYIGFGPSAVSFLKKILNNKDIRYKNISNLISYIENPLKAKREIITEDKALWETIFLNLRRKKGLSKRLLYKTNNQTKTEKIIERINYLTKNNILRENKNYWYIPEKNFLISNEILLWILKDM